MEKITVNKFNFYYGDFHALHDINLEIEKGKVTALIGPSGCGKSTFLKSINRMNDFVETSRYTGEITYENSNIVDKNCDVVELRKKIGMVFQKPNPFPKSIRENITYALKIHGVRDRKKLDEIVERTLKDVALWEEVKDKLDKSALSLSGGQQQRLCIARTIALEPEIILMDEPTSALDPISTAKIEELMNKLKKKYTIVIVTHSMQQAARISDKTAFFLMGYLVEFDDTTTVFSTPKDKRTEDYITGRFG